MEQYGTRGTLPTVYLYAKIAHKQIHIAIFVCAAHFIHL